MSAEAPALMYTTPSRTSKCSGRHVMRRSGEAPSFSERMESVAVAANDFLGPGHFLFKGPAAGCEFVGSIGCFNQKERFAVTYMQTMDNLFGQDDTQGIAEFADFEFDHLKP